MNSTVVSFGGSSPGRRCDDLACPRCGGPLAAVEAGLACAACDQTYPIRDGIVDLRCGRYDYYFNPLPRGEMAALTEAAKSQPWEDTVQRFLKGVKYNPEWLDDLVVDDRYAWKLLLRLPPNARVLDLGCGLGNLARNIAPHVGHVDALDLTLERLKFAGVRFEHFNVADRIRLLAGGDGAHLPFPSASFDCVTLSGVLEWVAADDGIWAHGSTRVARAVAALRSFFGQKNPRAIQRRFLAEIRRIVKPDGQLFIAIENRLSYTYFGGRPDHHSNLWFGSLLPRFVANVYSMALRRSPYRTYTYSVHGLTRLMRETGFPEVEFYGLTPGYTELAELIPLRSKGRLWAPPTPRGRDRIRRNPYFVPAYGMIASAAPVARRSLAEELAGSLAAELAVGTERVHFNGFDVTGRNEGVIRASAGDQQVVLKVPFNDVAAARALRNHRFLERASARGELAGIVPRPLAAGEVRGIRYYAEELLSGRPLDRRLGGSGDGRWLASASGFLRTLNPKLPDCAPTTLSGEFYEREVQAPLERVGRVVGPALAARIGGFLHARLDGVAVRAGTVHGDFAPPNVLVDDEGITGVVHWDAQADGGIPALDAIRFLDGFRRARNPAERIPDAIVGLFDFARLAKDQQEFLLANYGRCGLDAGRHAGLVVLYWMRHVAAELDRGLMYDRPAIDERATAVFEKLVDRDSPAGVE